MKNIVLSLQEKQDADAFDEEAEKTPVESLSHHPKKQIVRSYRRLHKVSVCIIHADKNVMQQYVELLLQHNIVVHPINSQEDFSTWLYEHSIGKVILWDPRTRREDGIPFVNDVQSKLHPLALWGIHSIQPLLSVWGIAPFGSATHHTALAEGCDSTLDFDSASELSLERLQKHIHYLETSAENRLLHLESQLVLELQQTLSQTHDMQVTLHQVSQWFTTILPWERCSIVLLDPDREDALMVAASDDASVNELRIQLPHYPELKHCMDTQKTWVIHDTLQEPLLENVHQTLQHKNIRSMLLLPLIYQGRTLGAFFCKSTHPLDHTLEIPLAFCESVAVVCAISVRHARLFEQYQDQHARMNSIRMMAERQMASLKRYEDFFEYGADGMIIIDKEHRILYVNREGRKLLGRSKDELKSIKLMDLLNPESERVWQHYTNNKYRTSGQHHLDLTITKGLEQEERIFSFSIGSVGKNAELRMCSFRDVTETKELESELRTTKEFLENLIDNSVDAIVAADMRGRIILFNKGAERITGYRADDVIGKLHINKLYAPGVATEIMRILREENTQHRSQREVQRHTLMNAHGEEVPVNLSASIIYDNGQEVATVGVFTDLRNLITMEKQLLVAQDEVLKSQKARMAAELAGMAAHELNQPLTSVLGYAEILKSNMDIQNPRLIRSVDTIYQQALRMAEIVRKIGRITKYETKRYGLSADMIDLARSVDDHAPSLRLSTPPHIISSPYPLSTSPQGETEEFEEKTQALRVAPAGHTAPHNIPVPQVSEQDFEEFTDLKTDPGHLTVLPSPTMGKKS
jgi:PAS domain S-box-containing protein